MKYEWVSYKDIQVCNTPNSCLVRVFDHNNGVLFITHNNLNITREGEWIQAPGFRDQALEMKDAEIAAIRKERDDALQRFEALELSFKRVAVNIGY